MPPSGGSGSALAGPARIVTSATGSGRSGSRMSGEPPREVERRPGRAAEQKRHEEYGADIPGGVVGQPAGRDEAIIFDREGLRREEMRVARRHDVGALVQ